MYNLSLYEDVQSFTAPRVMKLYKQNLRKLERKFGSIEAAKNAAHEILQGKEPTSVMTSQSTLQPLMNLHYLTQARQALQQDDK